MGKRSDFERVERDYYRSFDPKIGNALRGYLDASKEYIEPFAGANDLVNQFPELKFTSTTDIEPQVTDVNRRDAFTYTTAECKGKILLTNPPWDRDFFKKAIDYFTPMCDECWWVIDANIMFTLGFSDYMRRYVTDAIVVGRCKWIEGTKMSSKDDVVWLRTVVKDPSDTSVTFYPRA